MEETSSLPTGFELAIPTNERPHTYALDHAVSGMDTHTHASTHAHTHTHTYVSIFYSYIVFSGVKYYLP
jgi:hypothetical protein